MPSDRVKNFYECESFAIVGMSRNRKNFAWAIFEQLTRLGKKVYAVSPNEGEHQGVEFYRSISSLPEVPEAIILSLDPGDAKGVLHEVKDSGAKYVWFQQGSFDEEMLTEADRLGMNPIKGCAIMYLPDAPVIHRFHRALNEFFGKGYK
jgi:predicted CoA-binding protein